MRISGKKSIKFPFYLDFLTVHRNCSTGYLKGICDANQLNIITKKKLNFPTKFKIFSNVTCIYTFVYN